MLKIFRKIQSADSTINRLQSQIEQSLNPVLKQAILDGVIINDIAITTAGVEIEHGLGRQPLGWALIDNQADARIWRTAWTDRLLTLDASGTSTISIYVF